MSVVLICGRFALQVGPGLRMRVVGMANAPRCFPFALPLLLMFSAYRPHTNFTRRKSPKQPRPQAWRARSTSGTNAHRRLSPRWSSASARSSSPRSRHQSDPNNPGANPNQYGGYDAPPRMDYPQQDFAPQGGFTQPPLGGDDTGYSYTNLGGGISMQNTGMTGMTGMELGMQSTGGGIRAEPEQQQLGLPPAAGARERVQRGVARGVWRQG
ncbi:hypothetical protein B0H14DRAFT_1018218 [Mycena olivaceomarginata]|nr:hypothetical protein B0H14DRAFT_1018218 [Mycena olivaceomarginata]